MTVPIYVTAWLPVFERSDGTRHAAVAWGEAAARSLLIARPDASVITWHPRHDVRGCRSSFSPPECMRRYHELAASKFLSAACASGPLAIMDADALATGNVTDAMSRGGADVTTMVYHQYSSREFYNPAQDLGFWGVPERLGRFMSPGVPDARLSHCLAVMRTTPRAAPLLRRSFDLMGLAMGAWWENRSADGGAEREFLDRPPSRPLMQQSFAWAIGESMSVLDIASFQAGAIAASEGEAVARVCVSDVCIGYMPYSRKTLRPRCCAVSVDRSTPVVMHVFGTAEAKLHKALRIAAAYAPRLHDAVV